MRSLFAYTRTYLFVHQSSWDYPIEHTHTHKTTLETKM